MQSLSQQQKVPKPRTPNEWANENRFLPIGSAEPGPWRSGRTPYMIPIVKACADPQYRRVIAVMGSQMGKTAGLFNVIGHRLDDDPAPIIYVGPTRNNIDQVIEPKLMALLKQVPSLWEKLAKGKKVTKTHKRISGVSLRLAWAGSATELASDSAVLVLVDEIDRMPDIKGEGQVFELAEARTSTYADGKVIGTSTPTLGNVDTFIHPQTGLEHWAVSDTIVSPIWRLWQEGTRHEWAWPCPNCNEYFIPRFKQLWWPEKSSADEARSSAKLKCPHCENLIEDDKKTDLNQRGCYVAPGQSITKLGEVTGIADTHNSDTASFWASGICSFSSKKTFGFLAKKFIAAVKSSEPERIQSVFNTDFGELYRVGGDAPPWTAVRDCGRGYAEGELPAGVRLLTAGVDVQKNRLVYVVRGWGAQFESWLIDYGELWGETEKPAIWQRLNEFIHNNWQGQSLSMVAIDSGYQTSMVYQFCRQHKGLALATKGHDSLDKPFYKSDVDVNVRGKTLKQGLPLWHFNCDQMKSWIHSKIEWPIDQPGGWWLPNSISEDYCQQMVSEQRIVKPNGRAIWLKVKKDNHYLDAESLAFLAVKIITAGRSHLLEAPSQKSFRKVRRVISQGISFEVRGP